MKTSFLAIIALFFLTGVSQAASKESFSKERAPKEDESVLDAVFSSPPPPPTQHGLLIIEAFHDENGDGKKNSGEAAIEGDLFCLIDNVEYIVPAFVPGMEPGTPYPVLCAGERFTPSKTKETVLFRYKGEIITLLIAGAPAEEVSVQESSPVMISRHPSKRGE